LAIKIAHISDFRSCDSTDYGLRHRIVYPTDCIL
jgi:hypothetical protein